MAARLAAIPGVTRVAPLIKGQVMGSANSRNTGVEVFGISPENLATIPRIANPDSAIGDIDRFAICGCWNPYILTLSIDHKCQFGLAPRGWNHAKLDLAHTL
jgi:hypothetical protein